MKLSSVWIINLFCTKICWFKYKDWILLKTQHYARIIILNIYRSEPLRIADAVGGLYQRHKQTLGGIL